jgi:hypothetical protein
MTSFLTIRGNPRLWPMVIANYKPEVWTVLCRYNDFSVNLRVQGLAATEFI